jgi:hypothetical protein
MRAIFISYRRNDAEGEAGRLFDDLVREFGEQSVFMDVSTLEAGRDFRKAIDESVGSCGVLLSMIGTSWLDAKNEAGERRLDDPADFVRLETASALKRDIPVIPVLVRGAKMPIAGQLPDDLKDLAYRNAAELTHARWNSDVQLLVKALRPFVSMEGESQASGPAGSGSASARVPGSRAQQPPKSHEASPFSKGPLILKVLLGLVGLVVLVATIRYMTSPSGVAVPDLSGSTRDDAAAKLEAAGLAVGKTSTQTDPGKPSNTVVSQSPTAGITVARGTRVDLTVATASTPTQPPAGEQQSPPSPSKPHAPDGEVLIMNANSGLCLSPAGGGKERNTEIVQFTCDRDPARVWRFVPVDGDVVKIRNINSGMCLTVAGGNTNLNDHSVQYFCDDDPSRRWHHTVVNETTFRLVNVNSDLCLTVTGASTERNIVAVQNRCEGDPSLDWRITQPR